MADLLFTYDTPVLGSYGEVYRRAAQLLKKKGISAEGLNLERFAETYDFSDEYLREEVQRIKPRRIISHDASLKYSLQNYDPRLVQVLQEEIEDFFIKEYWGRIQSSGTPSYAQRALEFKEGFVKVMREQDLPIPPTILRSEVVKSQWNYNCLSSQLDPEGVGFILKDINKQSGKGVSLVKSVHDFSRNENLAVAQKKVTPTGTPCGLRVITFSGEMVGAFFSYNVLDEYRTNPLQGYRKHVLYCAERQTPLETLSPDISSLMEGCGIKLKWEDNQEIIDLSLRISRIPSLSLLRGIDFVFDAEGNPYVLEAQTGPGNPSKKTYTSLLGVEESDSGKKVDLAARVLAGCWERSLQS